MPPDRGFTRAEVCRTEVDHFLPDGDSDHRSRTMLGIGALRRQLAHSDAHEPARPAGLTSQSGLI
jgi:hypothetical protein